MKSMLNYTKSLLQKISFDRLLFIKELKKSLTRLKDEEIINLKYWCLITFPNLYQNEIFESYHSIPNKEPKMLNERT